MVKQMSSISIYHLNFLKIRYREASSLVLGKNDAEHLARKEMWRNMN